MRRFNPEKELYKIQHENRNKILYAIILLLLIISIGSTYALYQVRYSKRIIYTKVSPFSNKDIELAVYWGDTKTNKFPDRGSEYIYDYINCDNGSTADFNYGKWQLDVHANGPDKCDVHFKKIYKDNSGANVPELYKGLIPVTFDANGKVYAANLEEEWYDYEDHRWGNAVLVDYSKEEIKTKYFNEDGSLKENKETKEIQMEEILQMYVWIPRYKYQLFNVNNGSINPQEIQIEFESGTLSTGTVICEINATGKETCNNPTTGQWYTHPAFKFGNTELTGIWVGKFETSGNNTNIKVIPNVVPLVNQNISYMFNASRDIEKTYASNFNLNKNQIDTHMMKNMEWGAMAYLTHSKYGRCTNGVCTEVTRNAQTYKTGYDDKGNLWNTSIGQLASTTGNMYGIYDTNGDAHDYAMGNMVNASGVFYSNSSGLTSIDEKYYDKYQYDASSSLTHARGHLGDATRETLQTFGDTYGGWYDDLADFPSYNRSWLIRGGRSGVSTAAGSFAFGQRAGEAASDVSFRLVLTAQDGNV